MNEQELRAPSENYKTLQGQLVEALHVRPHSDWNEIHRLRPLLINEFEEEFKFKISTKSPGTRKREARMLLEKALRAEGHGWKDFDHIDYAKRAGFEGEIIISQPYGVATEVHQRLAAKFSYAFTQADEWTYYYPGRSHLFIVTVPRDAIPRLRKAYQTGRFARP